MQGTYGAVAGEETGDAGERLLRNASKFRLYGSHERGACQIKAKFWEEFADGANEWEEVPRCLQWDKKKKCRKYGEKQYRREFQEVDKRTKNCRQDVKLMRIPRSEGTGKGGI